ncbi:unnamed protein product [Paramecium pentaurelia]|uniref:Uncharacterized protein n=1 Tax=Paramecium pentaurelia TaxID=43138 RepID=A0A8S1VM49_9CILI|nr:unnamed protein product [Paramecium pentaurelia]
MSQNKIILLGDCGVGKTTILHKFLDINSQPETTIGVQHHSFSRNNIKFSIWDTAGQEKYRSIVSSHYKRAKAALLIYDCSSEETLLHIDKWIEELIFQVGTKIIMILIGVLLYLFYFIRIKQIYKKLILMNLFRICKINMKQIIIYQQIIKMLNSKIK